MNKLVILLLLFGVACSSTEKRTKFSDKNLRVMVDPESVSAQDYVSIQTALVKSDMFAVIDRSKGFQAIKKEQDREHRNESDRYSNKEKWAQWGKLYGIGAVLVGHSQCTRTKAWFTIEPVVNRCKQFLNLVDANTGEVIVAVEGSNDQSAAINSGSFNTPSDWKETIEKLVEAYPKEYKPQYYSEKLENYRDVSEEEAKRQEDEKNKNKK